MSTVNAPHVTYCDRAGYWNGVVGMRGAEAGCDLVEVFSGPAFWTRSGVNFVHLDRVVRNRGDDRDDFETVSDADDLCRRRNVVAPYPRQSWRTAAVTSAR
jgi:hypothetical protein